MRRVAEIIRGQAAQGYRMVVVVSAMGHSTDALVDLARQIHPYPAGREYDALLSTGEMVSTALMAMLLNQMGAPAVGLNGQQAGIFTENVFNRARIVAIHTEIIRSYLDEGKIVIVTGFQGVNPRGEWTTLGRGGSDTSAVALAGALGAERCDIYTDVRGVFSTDPRIVPEAVKLSAVADIEMLELARVGAQVLHPRAVETARQTGVPVRVRSTFDLDDPGTVILGVESMTLERPVTGVACDKNQARVALLAVPDRPGVAADIFGALAHQNISVDMIIQSLSQDQRQEAYPTPQGDQVKVNDIAFTVQEDDLPAALEALTSVQKATGARAIVTDQDIAKVSIVGAGMIDRPGIASEMFQALADGGINIKMIATSEIKISCLVDRPQAEAAVRVIHRRFFPEGQARPHDDGALRQPALINEKLGY
jgi:aspartate kinase